MDNGITVFLGAMDFLPATVMFIGHLLFYAGIKQLVKKQTALMIMVSSAIIWVSSSLKAAHKTVIGAGGPDIEIFYRIFWVGMAVGCMWQFITLINIEKEMKKGGSNNGGGAVLATMPMKPVFMLVETVGLFGAYIMMLRFAVKLRKKSGIAFFALSIALIPVQLYLGRIFTDTSAFHWLGQTVNLLSALFFTLGVIRIRNDMERLPQALDKQSR